MDPWSIFFLVCFLVGVLFIGISFILGSFGGHHVDVHGGHHGDIGHAGGHGGDHGHVGDSGDASDFSQGQDHADARVGGPSPFNLNTIMIFLTWFGGIGYILQVYTGLALLFVLPVATLSGLAGGAAVFLFLARIIYPNVGKERFINAREITGTLAKVTSGIQANGVGEIVYSKGGTRRTDGARSIDGRAIPRDTEVVIVRYQNGLAYVQPFDQFLAESDARKQLAQPSGQRIPDLPQRERVSKDHID